MRTAVLHILLVSLILIGPGLPTAYALVRCLPMAVVTAPLVTALACSVAAVVSLVLRGPLGVGLLLVFVPLVVVSLGCLRRPHQAPVTLMPWGRILSLIAVLAVPLLAIQRAPVDWDARWIWFFHSDWFWIGGAKAAAALANPDFAFSHPDYPPLAPATVASVWTAIGHDYEVAQLTIAFLVGSATLAVALSVERATGRLSARFAFLIGATLILGAYGMAGPIGTDGYVDLLWAAAFVAGTVCLLLGQTRTCTNLGALYLAVSMLTKNEGMVAGGVVLALAALQRDTRRRMTIASVVPLLLAAVWVFVSKGLGAESDLPGQGRVSGLLHLTPEVTSRIGPTLSALWHWCRWEMLVAALLTGVGFAMLRRRAIARPVASPARLWPAIACCLGSISLAYLLSPYDVRWHLQTSAARTTLAPRLMLLVEGVLWMVVLARGCAHREVGLGRQDGLEENVETQLSGAGRAGQEKP